MLGRIYAALSRGGWTPAHLPDLAGRRFVITGGSGGLGYEAARLLASHGGDITILCRNEARGAQTMERLRRAVPGVQAAVVPVDVADLGSVRSAAAAVRERVDRIDALIANAGVMALPKRQVTADGFEMQLAANHLGHFALAGLLFDLVERTRGRFVAVSSVAHKQARIDFDDLQSARAYDPGVAYGQSKLANLLFARELDRRLRLAGGGSLAVACHPGVSATNLFHVQSFMVGLVVRLFGQPAERGAWPEAMAAASPEVESGQYYGPTGPFDWMGPIGRATIAPPGQEMEVARRLWEVSEQLTEVRWTDLAPRSP